MTIHRHVQILARKVANYLKLGVVRRINDSTGIQTVQIESLEDEVHDRVPHMHPYGFTAHPPKESECIVAALGGAQSNGVVLVADSRPHRPTGLAEGECGLHLLGEFKVFLAEDGTLHLGAKDPGDAVALASKVEAEFEAIKAALNSVAGAGGNGGVDLTGTNTYTSVGSVGSSTIKAE